MDNLRFGISIKAVEEKDFESYKKAGVQELELAFPSDRYDYLEWGKIKQRAERYGIHLWSFHLPFLPFDKINIASPSKEIRDFSVAYQSELIKKAADIGIENIIIHPSGEPNEEKDRAELLKYAQQSLVQLAELAGRCSATIAVENLPRTCLGRNSKEINQLILADDRLRVCFDTNHLLMQPIKEFLLDVGDKIITTHFSDYDFVNERHWMPGEGKINWQEVIETLEAIGYSGPILYEVVWTPTSTIERRALTCEDFKENYYLLKNKLPLFSIGKPLV